MGLWVLGAVGLSIMLLGAYVAGGTDVTCTRVGTVQADRAPVVAQCIVRTRRWLGRRIAAEQTYAPVTGADRTSGSRGASLKLMAERTKLASIGATREQAERAYGRLHEWFTGDEQNPVEVDISEWPFAYAALGFGALWFAALRAMVKGAKARRVASVAEGPDHGI